MSKNDMYIPDNLKVARDRLELMLFRLFDARLDRTKSIKDFMTALDDYRREGW